MGTEITTDDCGGAGGGLYVKGCHRRKTPKMCNDATIPGKYDKHGNDIKACYWQDDDKDPSTNKEGGKWVSASELSRSVASRIESIKAFR